MKSRVLSVILLASSAAACAPSASHVATAPTPAPDDVPPVLALLSERERLSLTGAQVAALDSIAREWQVANDKLNRQLGAVRGKRPAGVALALRPGAKPTRAALAENNRRTAEAVEQVLTPAQRQSVCALQSSVRAASAAASAGRPAALPGVQGLLPGGGSRATRPTRVRTSRGWPWCTPDGDAGLAQARR